MKLCQTHWNLLYKAIEATGLPMSAQSSEEANRAIITMTLRRLKGKDIEDDYDALVSAFWNIGNHAVTYCGLEFMLKNECPICESRKAMENHILECENVGCTMRTKLEDLSNWVNHAAKAELEGYQAADKSRPLTQ